MYQIDNQSRYPVYEQIIKQFERYLLSGVVQPGEQMPSVRNLSVELHLNPNTVQRAYTELERRGLTYSSPGRGSFISDQALILIRSERRQGLTELRPQIAELLLSGVTREELLELIDEVMKEQEKAGKTHD